MIIEDLMLDLMYQVPNQKKVREVTITREVVLAKDKPITLDREGWIAARRTRWKFTKPSRLFRSATSSFSRT